MSKLDFTYASNVEHNIAQRLIIKLIENLTGRRKLLKIYKNYSPTSADPKDFWTDIINLMEIKIINKSKERLEIPKIGP